MITGSMNCNRAWAALSTSGRLVLEEHAEKPVAVIEGVRNVVAQVRMER